MTEHEYVVSCVQRGKENSPGCEALDLGIGVRGLACAGEVR